MKLPIVFGLSLALVGVVVLFSGCGGAPLEPGAPACDGPIDFEPCKGATSGSPAECWVGDGTYTTHVSGCRYEADLVECVAKCENGYQ